MTEKQKIKRYGAFISGYNKGLYNALKNGTGRYAHYSCEVIVPLKKFVDDLEYGLYNKDFYLDLIKQRDEVYFRLPKRIQLVSRYVITRK